MSNDEFKLCEGDVSFEGTGPDNVSTRDDSLDELSEDMLRARRGRIFS